MFSAFAKDRKDRSECFTALDFKYISETNKNKCQTWLNPSQQTPAKLPVPELQDCFPTLWSYLSLCLSGWVHAAGAALPSRSAAASVRVRGSSMAAATDVSSLSDWGCFMWGSDRYSCKPPTDAGFQGPVAVELWPEPPAFFPPLSRFPWTLWSSVLWTKTTDRSENESTKTEGSEGGDARQPPSP